MYTYLSMPQSLSPTYKPSYLYFTERPSIDFLKTPQIKEENLECLNDQYEKIYTLLVLSSVTSGVTILILIIICILHVYILKKIKIKIKTQNVRENINEINFGTNYDDLNESNNNSDF
jgi:hypothetical protein